ncbi:DUF6340 family protein, partial [Bacteroidota bacterium]
FSSCYTPNYSIYVQNSNLEEVEIEVLRPAKIDIPPQYFNVLFIKNRSIENETRLMEYDRFYKTKKEKYVINHSIYNYCEELSYSFQNLPKYKFVNNKEFPLQVYKNDSINWDSLQLVCRLNEADAAIIISGFKSDMTIVTDFNPFNFMFIPYYRYDFTYAISAEMMFVDPFEKKILDKIMLNNSHKWIEERDYKLNISTYCTNINDHLSIYPAELAKKYSKRISPFWNSELRKYYGAVNSDFNQTVKYVRNDEWEKAKEGWQQFSISTKKNLANRANYNLILAYEMEGELEKALKQSEKSYLEYRNYYSLHYGKLIKERIQDQEILKKQLGEE